jgi:hypothetical protein
MKKKKQENTEEKPQSFPCKKGFSLFLKIWDSNSSKWGFLLLRFQ